MVDSESNVWKVQVAIEGIAERPSVGRVSLAPRPAHGPRRNLPRLDGSAGRARPTRHGVDSVATA